MNILKRIIGAAIAMMVLSSCATTWVSPNPDSASAQRLDRRN